VEGTYEEKMGEFMEALKKEGWSVKTSHNLKALKIPHATSPDGKMRLWFKARAVHYGPASSDIGDAHTLTYEDLKGYSVSAFMKLVAKAMGEGVSEAAMRDPSGPIGKKIMAAIGNLRGDIEDAKRKLSDLEDAWEEHDWEWMKNVGFITAREAADMVAYEKSLSEE
jgi:hypothetical protein